MKLLTMILIVALTAVSLQSCRQPIEKLSENDLLLALSTGYVHGNSYSDSDRLNMMKPPVVVVSIGGVSHGVFREKYKTYDVVVRDGSGKAYTFSGTEWETLKIGDVIKGFQK